ncbi:MAG: FAD-binding oxidoreductase, partial [Actinomycetota bacterium]|nr:FAD-binding oxidoreductase [Actinomycetota bacterium]
MSETSEAKHLSFWIDTTPRTDYPPMSGDVSADVAVLGGGITGLTAAVLLKRLGKTVALVEMHKVAEGVSGHTTAKVTSQQGLIYNKLIEEHGEQKALLYARANEAAIDRIEAFVNEKGIDCDFSVACRPSPTPSPPRWWANSSRRSRPQRSSDSRPRSFGKPAMASGLSLDTLMLTIGDLKAVGREDFYKVLLTAVPPWPYRRGPRARAALERTGASLFEAEVRRLEAFETATEEG